MRNLMDLMAPNGCHPAIQPLRMPKGRCQFAGKEGFAFLQHLAASNKTHLRHTQEQLRSNAVLLSSSSSRHLWSSMTLILISSSSSSAASSSSSSSQPRRALLMIVRVWGRVNCRAFQLKRARAQDSANRDPCSRQFSADWRHRSTDSGQSPAEIKFQMFCIKWIMNHYSNIFESLTFLTNFACFTQYSTPSITIICWRVMLHPVVFLVSVRCLAVFLNRSWRPIASNLPRYDCQRAALGRSMKKGMLVAWSAYGDHNLQ